MGFAKQHAVVGDSSKQHKRFQSMRITRQHSKRQQEDEFQTNRKLPEEILILIFKSLTIADRIRVERVCKSWQEAAKQSWNNLKDLKLTHKFLGLKPIRRFFEHPGIRNNNQILEAILKRSGKYLKKIDINHNGIDDAPSKIANNCPNINSVAFDQFTVQGLKKLSKSCRNIYEINIGYRHDQEFGDSFTDFISSNKNLKVLNMPQYKGTGKFLTKLPFKEITTIHINSIIENHEDNLINAIKKSRNLSSFTYEDCREDLILEIGNSCNNLTELDLTLNFLCHDNDKLDSMLSKIFSNNKKIKIVRLDGFNDMSGKCFLTLNENVEEIALIDLPNLEDDYLIKSWTKLTKLHTLELKYYDETTYYPKADCISVCSNLRKLTSCNFGICEDDNVSCLPESLQSLSICWQSTQVSMQNFLDYLSYNLLELKYLDLGGCNELTDNGLKSICKLPKLEELRICGNENITGSGFGRMVFLKKLICEECENLQDDGLIKLLRSAKKLEYLNIEDCSEITNTTIDAAIELLKNRKNNTPLEINVRGTSVGVREIRDNLPPLLYLSN